MLPNAFRADIPYLLSRFTRLPWGGIYVPIHGKTIDQKSFNPITTIIKTPL